MHPGQGREVGCAQLSYYGLFAEVGNNEDDWVGRASLKSMTVLGKIYGEDLLRARTIILTCGRFFFKLHAVLCRLVARTFPTSIISLWGFLCCFLSFSPRWKATASLNRKVLMKLTSDDERNGHFIQLYQLPYYTKLTVNIN